MDKTFIADSRINMLEALPKGRGLQYLVNEGCRILGNPILTHDMEYKVIAFTENVAIDDPIWNEFAATGMVSYKTIEFYKEESFLDDAANAKKTTALRSGKLKYDRLFGKLFNRGGIQIGAAALVAKAPFAYDTPELFERFCDILNREFALSDYYIHYGQKYQEAMINKLIDGDIMDKEIYPAHVESIYINLAPYLYVAVADIPQSGGSVSDLRDKLMRTYPGFKYSVYNGRFVFIMSSDSPTLYVKSNQSRILAFFREHNAFVGISGRFENLFEMRKYYLDALAALERGLASGGAELIFLHDE